MGWLFTRGFTKADVIAEVTDRKPFEHQGARIETVALAKSLKGNALWVAYERTTTRLDNGAQTVTRFIALFLLQSGRESGWGYKDMDESSHPYTYSCPLSFFDLVPTVACAEWRDMVRGYWKAEAARKAARKTIVPGAVVKLTGCTIPEVTITEVNGRVILGTFEGKTYRVPARAIAVPV